MTDRTKDTPSPLASTLALLEREAARRAKGTHPEMMRLDDAEIGVLLKVLRREVGTIKVEGAAER